MSTTQEPETWQLIDPWWRSYAESERAATDTVATNVLGQSRLTNQWSSLDAWWETYSETGHDTVVDLVAALEASTQNWQEADGPFDADPLDEDMTADSSPRGPLLPSREEDWSQWLAQLLRTSPEFVSALFDEQFDDPPETVHREAQLPNRGGTTRFADVLVCYEERGFSIEVKLGDESFAKTIETAELIEQKYDDRYWSHFLLLPASQTPRLEALLDSVAESAESGGLRLEADDVGHVTVLLWEDVTASLRSMLRRGKVVDDHWAANAYLFCAAVEQQILGFKPRPVIERLAAPSDVVETLEPIQFADTLDQQLTYLRERNEL